jgi:hypothetical protein
MAAVDQGMALLDEGMAARMVLLREGMANNLKEWHSYEKEWARNGSSQVMEWRYRIDKEW